MFTAPDPLVAGPVDISLLVQDRASDAVLGDAAATGTLSGVGRPTRFDLTHPGASNKLMLAGTPVLSRAGNYQLQLVVTRPGQPAASFDMSLPVASNHGRRTTLIFALLLPLAAIFLFLVNQQAKYRAALRRVRPQ